MMPCFDAGDARADKQFGDIYIRAATDAGTNILLEAFTNLYQNQIGINPTSIGSATTNELPYVIDFYPVYELYARDMGMRLSWIIGHNTYVSVWQPSFVPVPESIVGRVAQWDNGGTPMNKWVQGFVAEADTGNLAKVIVAQGENGQSQAPRETFQFNGRGGQAFSFDIPMVTHVMRLRGIDDGIDWRLYNLQWIFEPYPELAINWMSVPTSHGFMGWQHVREVNIGHRSTADLTLVITPDVGPGYGFTIPNSHDLVTKTKVTINAPMKAKVFQYYITSSAAFYLFLNDIEVKVKSWGSTGPYQVVKPFGGPSRPGAIV
jgi:hypothetical protein